MLSFAGRHPQRTLGMALVLSAMSAACGSEPYNHHDASAPPPSHPLDAGVSPSLDARPMDTVDAAVELDGNGVSDKTCGSPDGLRLFYVAHGNNRPVYGAEVMHGPGMPYIIVDGECRLFVRYMDWDPVTVRALNAQQLAELEQQLEVSKWPAGETQFCQFGYDVPLHSFGSPGSRWDIVPRTPTDACREPPKEYIRRAQDLAMTLRPLGTPLEGMVAFSLVPSYDGFEESFRGAVPWTLGPLAEAVRDDAHLFRVVNGEQARVLRALRESFLRGDVGTLRSGFIPIEHDGARYELRLRDVLPFEDERGSIELR